MSINPVDMPGIMHSVAPLAGANPTATAVPNQNQTEPLASVDLPNVVNPLGRDGFSAARTVSIEQAVTSMMSPVDPRSPNRQVPALASEPSPAIAEAIAQYKAAQEKAAALSVGIAIVSSANQGIRRITQGS